MPMDEQISWGAARETYTRMLSGLDGEAKFILDEIPQSYAL